MSSSAAIYERSPIWLQNLFVSARGWEFRHRRADDKAVRSHLDFLMTSQSWEEGRFRNYQIDRLQETLRIAFTQIPYYRHLARSMGCAAEDFKVPEDITQLPILDKQTLRGNEVEFINQSIALDQCSHGFTSGTTGTPINLYETQESFSFRWAFVARLRAWAGLSDPLYPRRVQFTGRDIIPDSQDKSTRVYWRTNWPGNALLCSTSHLSLDTVPYYVEKLSSFRPDLIEGYPSAMLIIARIAWRRGLKLPRPRALIVSAETLSPDDRAELEAAFGCRVFDQYAASEPSCFWCDCECGQMHINPEYGISEIVDENGIPVGVGEEGEVIVTSFLNPAMPLIRYRLGDTAILGSSQSCDCGRVMPRVERITGRVDDILFVPERGYVGRLDPAFKGLSEIIEAQIIQESLENIRVLIVPGAGFGENQEHKLRDNLQTKLGCRVNLEFEQVNSIPRGSNGKFRSVVSNVKHLYPDRM